MKWMLFFTLFSLNLFATDIVSIRSTSDVIFYGTTNTTFTLGSTDPSGDGHSDTTYATIYVPMKGLTDAGADNTPYFSLNSVGSSPQVTTLFDHVPSTSSTNYITLPLNVTVGSTSKYMHLAVKSGTNWVVAKVDSTARHDSANLDFDFSVTPHELCAVIASGSGATDLCSNLTTTSITASTQEILTYVFWSSSILSVGDLSVTPDIYGSYFKFKLSNRIFNTSNLIITQSNLRRGDKRVTGTFTSSAQMDSTLFYQALAFKHNGGNTTADLPTSSNTGSFFSDAVATSQTSDFTIGSLANNTPVTVSIAYVDKYKFATTLSNQLTQTPTQIEELLKKQNCYLLTAGFGEEHYVIDYFRNFRDQTLMKNFFGREFVHYYYKYAPDFALSIYNNESIRFAIRMTAYSLYFLFNYFAWVLAFILLIFGFIAKNKSKSFRI